MKHNRPIGRMMGSNGQTFYIHAFYAVVQDDAPPAFTRMERLVRGVFFAGSCRRMLPQRLWIGV